MPFFTRQAHLTPQEWAFYGVTIGIVVDTNDPQQMGRVRARCLGLNDSEDGLIKHVPWAQYGAPFGGTLQAGTRGSEDDKITGPTAYGMWGIPKVNTHVLIMCLDGNPQTRVWIGCLHTNLATHTLPHGRFAYTDNTGLPDDDDKPVGPISTFENNIEPLHTNLRTAFDAGHTGEDNFEFQSRGADFQAAGLGLGQDEVTLSEVEDDQDEKEAGSLADTDLKATNKDGEEAKGSRQGYQTSRIAPDQFSDYTPRNLDNMVTALVSPGFHAMSMDDRQENCRIRLRTTGGHQIIFDDTNERIYLATASGENWIELDQQGNIDIYTSGKISAHAAHDINFTSDRSIRMYGKAGIHLKSDQEIRITAENDISINTSAVLRAKSGSNILLESTKDIHLKATEDLAATAGAVIKIKSGSTLFLDGSATHLKASGGTMEISASGDTNINGAKVNLAPGGTADSAGEATESKAADFLSYFTNRIPDHEPWARSDTRADDTEDDLSDTDYGSEKVGRERRITATDGVNDVEIPITRGSKWRR